MDATRLKSISLFEEVGDEERGQGMAEVTRAGQHVADVAPGDFFGEIGLLERTLRSATLTAETPMRLVALTGWNLKRVERTALLAIERVRSMLEERRAAS